MLRLILITSLLALISCTPKSSGLLDRNSRVSIINGHDVKVGAPISTSIVGLLNVKEKYLCTGSLIAPNIILTAAHCMSGHSFDYKVIFANDIDDMMGNREQDELLAHVLNVTSFKVHENWKPSGDSENEEINTDDIAIVRFKGQVPEGYKPATFLSDDSVLKRGTMVTVAGYGVNTVKTEVIDPKKYPNLDDAINSGDVICDEGKRNCMSVEMDGDGILRQGQAPIASLQEKEIRLDEKSAGTCSGDSGGPAYVEKDGQLYLFGITSRGSGLCNDTGVYTNALEYKQWIVDTINYLNHL